METIEIIKNLCKKNGITVKQLERDLGFGNASINKKSGSISADRLLIVANYFNVSMEYLLGVEEMNDTYEKYAEIIKKIDKLNSANLALLESMVDTMLNNQD